MGRQMQGKSKSALFALALLVALSALVFARSEVSGQRAFDRRAAAGSGGVAGSGPSCPVDCPPGANVEAEPCGAATNNGCSGTCPNYFLGASPLQCGKTGCGSIFADGGFDTDWWVFTLPITPLTGEKHVCITVESEFPAVVQLWTGGFLCYLPTLLATHETDDCGSTTFCLCLPTAPLTPKYWINIYPGTVAGGPITSGLPCAADGRDYTVKLECEDHCPGAEPIFGACCVPSTDTPCLQTTELFCDLMGWVYAGDGVPCTGVSPCDDYGACCHQYPGSMYYPCVMTWEDDCLFSGSYIDPTFFPGSECTDPAISCPGVQCGPGAGPCDVPNGSPGCESAECCFQVCEVFGMAHCCAFEWTTPCVNMAMQACGKVIEPAIGRCCYVSDPVTGDVDCIETTQIDCLDNFFAGTWSAGEPCDVDDCTELLSEIGACCYTDAAGVLQCVQTTEFTCTKTFFGVWYPDTDCDPDPCPSGGMGACCVHADPPYCIDSITAAECHAITAPTTFHIGLLCADLGPDCEPPPTEGACCRPIPGTSMYDCAVLPQSFCEALPGAIYYPGLTCTDPIVVDECALKADVGACCHQKPGTTTFICADTTEEECDTLPNSTFHPGYDCLSLPPECCKQKVLGACCYVTADGTLVCDEMTKCECEEVDGVAFHPGLACADLGPNCTPLKLGACCHQDPTNGMWNCIEPISGFECETLFNSQFYPGLTCADVGDECPIQPPTGACCYLSDIPGGVAHLCVETTALDCAQTYGGSYLGDGTSCIPNPCPKDCITPPKHLLAWWTLDDDLTSGTTTLDSSGLGATGFAGKGVSSGGGIVNGAFHFNGKGGHVRVPNKSWLNPCPAGKCAVMVGQPAPMQSFTIDAWIKMDSLPPGSGMAPIVDKRLHGPPGPPLMKGYSFFVDGKGRLGLLLEDGCGPTASPIFSSAPVVTPGQVAHVAVTAHRVSPSTSVAEFYYNGASVSSHNISAWPCAMSHKAPLYIGAQPFYGYSTGDGPSFFAGLIDEVQIFRRALDPIEIFLLFNAGTKGKCKHRCIAPPNSICRNHSSKNVTIQVCNDSPLPQTYQVSFSPSVGGGCQAGLVIAPNLVNVNVPPLSCAPVTVNMSRPAGLASGLTWCYDVTVSNVDTGQTTSCNGTLTNYFSILCHIIWNDDIIIKKKAGVPSPIQFEIHPPDPGHPPEPVFEAVNWRISVVSPRGSDLPISLDGLPPGEPVEGTFKVPPGGPAAEIILPVTVEFLEHVPLEVFGIVLELDAQEKEGAGEYVTVAVTLVASDEPVICEADLNEDGVVGVADLLILLSAWGQCPPQIPIQCPGDLSPPSGDGAVGVEDLLALLSQWGECP